MFTFIISQTLTAKEDTGVTVMLQLEENDGKWEKEGNVKPFKKEPMREDF